MISPRTRNSANGGVRSALADALARLVSRRLELLLVAEGANARSEVSAGSRLANYAPNPKLPAQPAQTP
jgi:hypothetical protein